MVFYGIFVCYGEFVDLKNFFILYEGLIFMIDSEFIEISYDNMVDFEFN